MIKLNLGSGEHPLEGFVNLDKANGWTFQGGLLDYDAESVDAITVSHALMYVRSDEMPFVMREFYRVLKPGGVVRITEDDTRYWKWHGRMIDTTPTLLEMDLKQAGFEVHHVRRDTTQYRDNSLIQEWHPRAVSFYIEGVKPSL